MLRIFVMHDTFLTDLEVRAVKDGLSEFLRYNPRRTIRFLGSTPVRKNGEYFSADSFLIQSRHFSSLDFRRARKYDGNKILEAMDREAPYREVSAVLCNFYGFIFSDRKIRALFRFWA